MRRTGLASAGAGLLASMTLVGSANAADVPQFISPAPPPVVVAEPPANFTGPYIGGVIGYGLGHKLWDDYNDGDGAFDDAEHTVRGVLFGVEGGFRFQTGAFVFGIEGDLAFTRIDGQGGCLFEGVLTEDNACGTGISRLATLTGQAGFVPGGAGNLLIYGEAGVARAQENFWFDYNTNDDTPGETMTGERTVSGYVLGGGAVLVMGNGLYIKAEYNFTNFGTEDDIRIENEVANNRTFDLRQTLHVFKLGVGIQF